MASKWRQRAVRLMTSAMAMTALAGAGAASAHHSFAMYDNDKVVTLQGTVSEYRWDNPHVILLVMGVPPAGGAPQLWTLELSAPAQIARNGWSHSSLKAGDKVKVDLHPYRDGRLGGSVVSVTLPSGETLNRTGAPTPAGGTPQ